MIFEIFVSQFHKVTNIIPPPLPKNIKTKEITNMNSRKTFLTVHPNI